MGIKGLDTSTSLEVYTLINGLVVEPSPYVYTLRSLDAIGTLRVHGCLFLTNEVIIRTNVVITTSYIFAYILVRPSYTIFMYIVVVQL